MRLFEYQAKDLFRAYGIPTPRAVLANDSQGVAGAYDRLTHPVAIKAQVLAGGRGKAGGIAIVDSISKAELEARRIFGLSFGGEKPASLLVEEAYTHESEMYL